MAPPDAVAALASGPANGASNTAPPAASTSRRDHDVGAKTSLPSIATISPSTVPFWSTSSQQPPLPLIRLRPVDSAIGKGWLVPEGCWSSSAAIRNSVARSRL